MSFNRIKHYVKTIRIQSKKKYLSTRLHVRILKRNGGCFHAYVWLFMNSLQKKIFLSKNTHCVVSEHYQNTTEKWQKEWKSIPLTHKYMTAYFPGLVRVLQ